MIIQLKNNIEGVLHKAHCPLLKCTKEYDSSSGASIVCSVVMYNASECNRQVFTVYTCVTHEGKSKTFSKSSDAGPWAETLKAEQGEVEAYLADVLREF